MAQACKIMMDQGLLAMRGLCAAWRVSPWIRFATQLWTLVIMPGDEELQVPEEDVFLDGMLPLQSFTSEISTVDSTPREHAQYALRGDRIGETHQPWLVDANDDFNKMFDDELRDMVVLAFAHTSTPFTATRSGKKLAAVDTETDL